MKTQGQVSLRTGMVVVVLLLGLAYFQPIAADAGDDTKLDYLKNKMEPLGGGGGGAIAPEDVEVNEVEEVPVVYKPTRYIQAPYLIAGYPSLRSFNGNRARVLSPLALQRFLQSRFKNADFGKRMGSEFLGKRSGNAAAMLVPEKKMGSEFLGRR